MTHPYEVLGVSPEADDIVIEAAYKVLVKEHHPDQGGDPENFKRIHDAYKELQQNEDQPNVNDNTPYFEGFTRGLISLSTPVSSESIEGTLSDDLTIEKGPVKVSLVGLFKTDISEIVWDHEEDNTQTEDRFLCVFRIENVSDYVQPWRSDDVVFVGTDGQTYSVPMGSELAISGNSPLPPQYSIDYLDLEPDTWTLAVCAAEPLPSNVDIEKAVYNHNVFQGNQTDGHIKEKIRFEFYITDKSRKLMLSLIAKELMEEVPETTPLQKLTK